MQPAVLNLVGNTPQQAAGVLTLKLLAGDLSAINTGSVVRAAVTSVADGKAQLQVNGQPVTVRAQPTLTPGTELAVRVTPTGVEAVVIPPAAPTVSPNPTGPTKAPPPTAPVVVAPANPAAPPPVAASIPVAQLAAAPTVAPLLTPQPKADIAAPRTADGTVAPTTAPATTQTRAPVGIAPAPPPVAQQVVVPPNVSVRTATPPIPPDAGQAPPVPTTKARPRQPDLAPSSGTSPERTTALPQTTARVPATPSGVPRQAVPLPQLSVVEVLPPTADGVPRVRVDGREPVPAESAAPLTPGAKVIVQVERTPQGVRLLPTPTADTPQVTTAVVAALLKQERPPPVSVALPKLVKELQEVPQALAAKPVVARAVADLREAVRAQLPDSPRPPTAENLRALVEDNGQRYEAKLARQADGGDGPSAADLKGGLLKLFQAVPALAHSQFPAAKATLDGIEQQQGANVLSQQTGGPLVLQVPFPDGPHWRTLHLAVEPEDRGSDADDEQARPFRMLMHVPLSDLGDTWIDAGLNGNQFRAVLYLEQSGTRDRVRGELPALQNELQSSGFTDVLLDVRPTADLTAAQRKRGAAMAAGVPESTSVIDARA